MSIDFYVGALAGALITGVLLVLQRRPAPPPAAPPPAPPRFEDPLAERVFNLQAAIAGPGLPSTAEDFLRLHAFAAMVELLSDPGVTNETLLRYFAGRDLVPACAALGALARRPADAAVEELLLSRLNTYHPWSRFFILRVLEAWRPDDATLAGRVLLRLDGSWDDPGPGPILDDFLRRRAAVAPPSLAGLERRPGFDGEDLRDLLKRWVDPPLAKPLVDELEGAPAAPETSVAGPVPPSTALAWKPPGGVGRIAPPKGAHAEGVLAFPSADAQLERLLAALGGSPRRSALVVGEPGVGKTSLVRRACARLSQQGWSIYEASATQVNAGMMHVGSLEGRLHEILQYLAAHPRTLWVMPDFHQLLWFGRHMQNPTGTLEMLIPALESGQLLMLGETRPVALERVLAERPEVERLFEIVRLEPPTDPELAAMLETWAAEASREGRVRVTAEARAEAAALARQYLVAQPAPGGVLRLLGGALARAARRAAGTEPASLTMDDLVESLAELTGLPLDILDERCTLDLEAVRQRFESRVMGQREAVDCLVDRLALLKAGVTDPRRPTGVFLFVGGSGTGKTELARTLAEYLFGSPERLLRLDMSELQDRHAFERLLGDAQELTPKGTSLVERVRRQPFSVVLLDEFDRAHRDVWDVFLQMFDAGRLTDRRGDTADFRHTIIILTSNLGAASGQAPLGIVAGDDAAGPAAIMRTVERSFRPEFLNRLDRVVVFRPLTREVMRRILRKELRDAFARRGLRRRDWVVVMEESAIDLLVEQGFSPTLGARPLRRALERMLLTPLAAAIVNRSAPEGGQFLFVRADGDSLAVEFVDPDASATPAAALPGAAVPAGRDRAAIL